MKYAFLILFGLIVSVIYSSAQSSKPLADILRNNSSGDEAVKRVSEMSEDEKSEALDGVALRIQEIIKGTRPFSDESIFYISNAAYLMAECASDDAIIKVFGNLSEFDYAAERDAIHALTACFGPGGITLMNELARKRLLVVDRAIDPINDIDKSRSNEILMGFISLIEGLSMSVNRNGKEMAKHIRDDFSKRYVTENGKRVLVAIDEVLKKDMSPHLRKKAVAGSSDDGKAPVWQASPPRGLNAHVLETSHNTFWFVMLAIFVAALVLVFLVINKRTQVK